MNIHDRRARIAAAQGQKRIAELELEDAHRAYKQAMAALHEAEATREEEPRARRSVVRFSLKYDNGGTYDYAAIKTGSRWYTTGSTCPPGGWTWEALWSKLIAKGELLEFEIASFEGDDITPDPDLEELATRVAQRLNGTLPS